MYLNQNAGMGVKLVLFIMTFNYYYALFHTEKDTAALLSSLHVAQLQLL